MRYLLVWLGALLLATLVACPGSLEDPDRFLSACEPSGGSICTSTRAPATAEILAEVLRPRCGFSGCHSARAPQQGLDLATEGVDLRVVGITSTSTACSGRILVVAGDPVRSLLIGKITSAPPCGDAMPPTGLLEDDERQALRAWIDGLAVSP